MYGETNWEIYHSGSTATSADTAHNLFGLYGGLSLLSASDVVSVGVSAKTNTVLIYSGLAASSTTYGMFISPSTITYEKFNPMTVNRARNLHFKNLTNGANGTVVYAIWHRVN